MPATQYIDALSKELQTDITLSASGSVIFTLEDRHLFLQWLEKTSSFVIFAEVGPVGTWRRGDIFRSLLEANFLLADTHGGALSFNDTTNMVGINFILPTHTLDANGFLTALNAIIVAADDWHQRLQAMNQEQEELTAKAQQQYLAGTAMPGTPDATMLRI